MRRDRKDCGARPVRFNTIEEQEERPYQTVNFRIFDGGEEWDTSVKFFGKPDDIISESIAAAYEIVQAQIAESED